MVNPSDLPSCLEASSFKPEEIKLYVRERRRWFANAIKGLVPDDIYAKWEGLKDLSPETWNADREEVAKFFNSIDLYDLVEAAFISGFSNGQIVNETHVTHELFLDGQRISTWVFQLKP